MAVSMLSQAYSPAGRHRGPYTGLAARGRAMPPRIHGENHMNIYVGQLPYSVGEEDLKELFSEFGEIASINVVTDRYSGRPKGFAFVDMPNNSEADTAIKALNRSMLKGREIKVNQVQPQKKNKRSKRRFRRY